MINSVVNMICKEGYTIQNEAITTLKAKCVEKDEHEGQWQPNSGCKGTISIGKLWRLSSYFAHIVLSLILDMNVVLWMLKLCAMGKNCWINVFNNYFSPKKLKITAIRIQRQLLQILSHQQKLRRPRSILRPISSVARHSVVQ